MLDKVAEAWAWIGLDPEEIVTTNAFGNIIVRDKVGCYWRLCPEDAYCEIIAESRQKYEALLLDEGFLEDWEMTRLVQVAHRKLGTLGDGYCYCLKIPSVLGGEYNQDNFATVAIEELIMFSGDLAKQIRDLPDGARLELKVID